MIKPLFSLLIALALPAVQLSAGVLDIDRFTAKDAFTLRCGKLELTISPLHAFNINGIRFEEKIVGKNNGFYGLVVCYPGGNWVGTGHREGGAETVVSVELRVDGKPVELPYGGKLEGREIELIKEARIREDIAFRRVITLSNDRFRELCSGRFLKPTFLDLWYPFMYIWPETTTCWTAATPNAQRLSGTFESAEGWQLQKEARWLSLFDPTTTTGALTLFDASNPPGQGRKHAYWDLPRYHKQYLMAAAKADFAEGHEFRYGSTVYLFPARDEAAWSEAVEHLISTEIPALRD